VETKLTLMIGRRPLRSISSAINSRALRIFALRSSPFISATLAIFLIPLLSSSMPPPLQVFGCKSAGNPCTHPRPGLDRVVVRKSLLVGGVVEGHNIKSKIYVSFADFREAPPCGRRALRLSSPFIRKGVHSSFRSVNTTPGLASHTRSYSFLSSSPNTSRHRPS